MICWFLIMKILFVFFNYLYIYIVFVILIIFKIENYKVFSLVILFFFFILLKIIKVSVDLKWMKNLYFKSVF